MALPNYSNPGEMGRDLRGGSGKFLRRRRGIFGLTLFSCATLAAVALYQIGILKRLPQPRSSAFDTAKVNGSAEAYSILSIPDAFLGLASYSLTACFTAMGSSQRWRTHPSIPLGMGLKLLADAAYAGKLTVDECTKFKAFSVWSVLTAAATFAALPLAFPETKAALLRLKGDSNA